MADFGLAITVVDLSPCFHFDKSIDSSFLPSDRISVIVLVPKTGFIVNLTFTLSFG